MYNLTAEEKATTVMVYSQNMLVRGDLVTRQNVRVSIWLRTQGVPNYVHILKPQVLVFGGASPKPVSYQQIFFPVPEIIAFHIAPPAGEPPDYEPNEANRTMVDANLLVGTFTLKGKVRISTQTDFATSIEVARAAWVSVYEAEITNPYLPQMPAQHVPMLLVRPEAVSFGL